jgi:hypothetical protein
MRFKARRSTELYQSSVIETHHRLFEKRSKQTVVMAGLVPSIHAVVQRAAVEGSLAAFMQHFVDVLQTWRRVTAWIALCCHPS